MEALRLLVREPAERARTSTFFIEGPHLVERALEESSELVRSVYMTSEALKKQTSLAAKLEKTNVVLVQITALQARQLSDTRTTQGVFALVAMTTPKRNDDKCVIILDGVQDPGNVGTIIRAAAWFAAGRVLLGPGSADPFSPKTIRATQGEIFSVKCELVRELAPAVVALKKSGYKIFTTTLEAPACSIYKERFDGKCAVILGSEAHGISDDVRALSDEQLIIPRIGSGESLNVAMSAVIILSEIAARTRRG
jgi:TrmH family RNA methyltransferase